MSFIFDPSIRFVPRREFRVANGRRALSTPEYKDMQNPKRIENNLESVVLGLIAAIAFVALWLGALLGD